jgi:hypothetical protein
MENTQNIILTANIAIALFMSLAAFVTLLVALAVGLSGRETRKAAQSQLVASFLSYYDSREMVESLEKLSHFMAEHPRSYVNDLLRGPEELRYARRRVAHYFEAVCTLYQAGYMDEAIVKILAPADQVEMYLRLEPVEKMDNFHYDESTFTMLADLQGMQQERRRILEVRPAT